MNEYRPYTHSGRIDECDFKPDFVLLAGSSNPTLFKAVGDRLNKPVEFCTSNFANQEISVSIKNSVRGKHAFILNSTGFPKPNDYLLETALISEAAVSSDAAEVTAVMPKIGYDRQDRMNKFRAPISIGTVLKLLAVSGVDRITTFDIHSEQSAVGAVQRKDLLYGSYILAAALRDTLPSRPLVVAPDAGAAGRSAAFRGLLGIEHPVPQLTKVRNYETSDVEIVGISESVEGFDVILPDDVISSGSTTAKAAHFIKERGARTVTAVSTHGEFTGNWKRYFNESSVDRVLITDSINPTTEVLTHPKIEVYSLAPLISEAIFRTFYKKGISELFRALAPSEDIIRLNPR